MAVLLTNDDGIEAAGLRRLADALKGIGDLIVVAPAVNRSGVGHAITLDRAVKIREIPPETGCLSRLSVDGTPADAVKFAVKHHIGGLPDLVVSGINPGPNVGVNILYSGTVGAALEALLQGVSAVAVSVDCHGTPDWEAVRNYTRLTVKRGLVMEKRRRAEGAPPFCLNLNIPARPAEEIRGLKITRQGISGFDEFFHQNHDGSHDEWLIDGAMQLRDPDATFDAIALSEGFVSLTPLRIDLTDPELLERIRDMETDVTAPTETEKKPHADDR